MRSSGCWTPGSTRYLNVSDELRAERGAASGPSRRWTPTGSLLPLSESETDTLFCRVNDTIHATLYGMLALSALQGLLGGLMFWWLGVPSPWFWALVAAVFAFVPVLDTFVLWLPAAVYLGLEGRWGEALVVAALGSLLVRAIENFLYPVLVKDRLKVPSESIFVSLVGGLVLFGWTGLVLGPVILTTTSALLAAPVRMNFSAMDSP